MPFTGFGSIGMPPPPTATQMPPSLSGSTGASQLNKSAPPFKPAAQKQAEFSSATSMVSCHLFASIQPFFCNATKMTNLQC